MQRRSSTGSFRTSGLRVENRSLTERQHHSSFADDTLTEFRKTCRLCSDLINAGMVIVAAGHSWHVDCFVCSNCLALLSDYCEHEGKLLCKQCLIQLVGGCDVCKECLGTSYVISNDRKYHTKCFQCSQCRLPLGTNENYTLCGESQIICDNCHQSNILSLISGDKCVQVKWGDIKTELSEDCILRVTEANEHSPVRRNDIVMTINGNITSDVPLQDINPGAVVTLTISNGVSRSRNASETSPPPPPTSPPSPPPPFSRSHKRRINKSLSASPPPPEPYSSSYIFKPCMVEVGDVIGQGFYGRVRRAKLTRTGEIVCLKELQDVMDPVSAKLFVDEVALLKNLRHVNVLTFKGIVSSPHNFSLLTEYIDGGTLRKLIKKLETPIPWTQRLRIALDVSSGMAYLHSKEIIHRDLTSKNCLLRGNGSVVVADFGLAQYHHTTHYNTTFLSPPIAPGKRRNDAVGGYYWRAPEMIDNKPYDSKVDIFSYGIVMCELIARIKADPDILPRKSDDWGLDEGKFRELIPSDCPEPFLSVILQCCCPSPEHRPPFARICEFILHFRSSTSPEDYNEILFSITRTLHSIIEDD